MNYCGLFCLSVPSLITLVAGAVSCFIMARLWSQRHNQNVLIFIFMLGALAWWSLTDFLVFSLHDFGLQQFIAKIAYLGVVSVAPLWFLFALSFGKKQKKLSPFLIGLFFLVPVMIFYFALTNDTHSLIWSVVEPRGTEAFFYPLFQHGPWAYVNIFYSYALLIAGLALFLYKALVREKLRRTRAFLIIIGVSIPFVFNIAYITGIFPYDIDITGIAFALGLIFVYLAIFRYQFLSADTFIYETIFDKMNDGVVVLDKNNKIIKFNKAASRYLGINKVSVLCKSCPALCKKERGVMAKCVMHEGDPIQFSKIGKDGKNRDLSAVTSSFKMPEGFRGKIIVFRNISKLVASESNLRTIKDRYENLAQQSRTFTWEVDPQGMYKYVSPVVAEIIGYQPEELVDKKYFFELHPPAGRAELKKNALAMIAKKKKISNFENKLLTKKGEIIWVLTNGLPILSDAGKLRGYQGSDADITAIKESKLKLKKEMDKIERLNNLMIGRELKMIELKREILRLKNILEAKQK